jgi:hypothetical protein
MTEEVYIIQEGISNKYKIGRTANSSQERKIALQTANSSELRVVKIFKCDDSVYLEKTLHKYFKDKHIRGEWFELNENDFIILNEIVGSIKNICCKLCAKKYTCEQNFKKHLKSQLHMNNEKKCVCNVCGDKLVQQKSLWKHKNIGCNGKAMINSVNNELILKFQIDLIKKDIELFKKNSELELESFRKNLERRSEILKKTTELETAEIIKNIKLDTISFKQDMELISEFI